MEEREQAEWAAQGGTGIKGFAKDSLAQQTVEMQGTGLTIGCTRAPLSTAGAAAGRRPLHTSGTQHAIAAHEMQP